MGEFAGGIEPAHGRARDRVTRIAPPVPHDFADISAIAQEPLTAGRAPANRRLVPHASGWSGDPRLIELARDTQRALSAGIVSEDALDDHGLVGVNLTKSGVQFARCCQLTHNADAIGGRPVTATLEDAPFNPAPRLVGEIAQEHRAHHAAHADMERPDIPVAERDDADPSIFALLEECGQMFLVAGDAVQAFRQDDVSLARQNIRHERLIPWPKQRRARISVIGVLAGDLSGLALNPVSAEATLVFYRRVALIVTRVALVADNAQGHGTVRDWRWRLSGEAD